MGRIVRLQGVIGGPRTDVLKSASDLPVSAGQLEISSERVAAGGSQATERLEVPGGSEAMRVQDLSEEKWIEWAKGQLRKQRGLAKHVSFKEFKTALNIRGVSYLLSSLFVLVTFFVSNLSAFKFNII